MTAKSVATKEITSPLTGEKWLVAFLLPLGAEPHEETAHVDKKGKLK